MSKRFTESNKWDDPFYQDLTPVLKCLWIYITDKCDNAGIWLVNKRTAEFNIGVKIDWDEVVKIFGDKITVFENGKKWLINKFIKFQYGDLTPNSPIFKSVLKTLKKHGIEYDINKNTINTLSIPYQYPIDTLSIPYQYPIDTLQEEEEGEGEEKNKNKDKKKDKNILKQSSIPVDNKYYAVYTAFVNLWFKFYEKHCDEKFQFQSKHGLAIKKIIKAVIITCKAKNKEITDDYLINSFDVFLQKMPQFWCRNPDLNAIAGHYNEIIAQIKQNNKGIQHAFEKYEELQQEMKKNE